MSSVLVVDDEFDVAEVVRIVLEERGFDVILASDGAEAETILAAETPTLIITDVMMPHVSGFDLVQWARGQERLRDVPIIVMSAVRPSSTSGTWQAFLQKPFTLRRLVASIDEVLAHAR